MVIVVTVMRSQCLPTRTFQRSIPEKWSKKREEGHKDKGIEFVSPERSTSPCLQIVLALAELLHNLVIWQVASPREQKIWRCLSMDNAEGLMSYIVGSKEEKTKRNIVHVWMRKCNPLDSQDTLGFKPQQFRSVGLPATVRSIAR